MISYTNCKWEDAELLSQTLRNLIETFEIVTLIDLPRPSYIKKNFKGESKSPFLIPLDGDKVEVGEPFRRI